MTFHQVVQGRTLNTRIRRQFIFRKQGQNQTIQLKKDYSIAVFQGRPAKNICIKPLHSIQISDAQGDKIDVLFHDI